MKILITGSTGLIGSALVSFLSRGRYSIYRMVRRPQEGLFPNEISWDPSKGKITPHLLEGMDVVIHLCGENVNGYWGKGKKQRILESRIQSTELLAQAITQLYHPPKTFIMSSAIGFYGDRKGQLINESSSKGLGFLSDVCQLWEAAAEPIRMIGIRTISLRTGVVMSSRGGALKQMLPAFKWGLGSGLGSGDQYMSWIDLKDLIGAIYYMMRNSSLEGPVNAVSPNPVTNREFTRILAEVLHRKTFFSVPESVLKLFLGEMAEELLLASQRAVPQKLLDSGFRFEHPTLLDSLIHLLRENY